VKVGGHGPSAINYEDDDDEYEVELHQTGADFDDYSNNKHSSDSKDKSDSDPQIHMDTNTEREEVIRPLINKVSTP
jgi:hypothetical protein